MYKNINIRNKDFDIKFELEKLSLANVGAIVSFTGLVREQIVEQAEQRWPLLGAIVIHRVGYLAAHEQIVLVAVASQHRQAAFEAAAFIMDFLKSKAPFWKKEYIAGQTEGHWVDAKDSDEAALAKWV